MEKVVIAAEFVEIHCFIGDKAHLYDTLLMIQQEGQTNNGDRNIKVVMMVYSLPLKDYSTFYANLKQSFPQEFHKHFINILMVKNREEVEEQLRQIKKVNESEFELNYLKLQEHSEKAIRLEIVESYIYSKFKWNKVKAKYFIDKNNVTSMQNLLDYPSLPFFEKSIVSKTLHFKQYCENAISNEGQQPDRNDPIYQ